jgi:hypothetical protein
MYQMKKGGSKPKMKKGGSFPDLTGDGKVTQADVLKGRGVFKKGGSVGPGDGKVTYQGSPNKMTVDTSGYAGGKKRFPVEVSSPDGKYKDYSMVGKKGANKIIKQQQAQEAGKPSKFPSFVTRNSRTAKKSMTTPKQKMGGSVGKSKKK